MSTIVPIMGAYQLLPLSQALFGKTRRAVLALLFRDPERSFFLREIARSTRAGLGAVQRELTRLSAAEIIHCRKQGRLVYYQVNRACPIFHDLHGLMLKTDALAGVLQESLRAL